MECVVVLVSTHLFFQLVQALSVPQAVTVSQEDILCLIGAGLKKILMLDEIKEIILPVQDYTQLSIHFLKNN